MPRWLDVHLVGYSAEGRRPDPVQVAGRTLPYTMYMPADFVALGFPEKGALTGAVSKLIPGNTDLIHLRFIADHPGYARYWWVEDDVRFGGHWSTLFARFRRHPAAPLGTSIRRRADDPDWAHWAKFEPPEAVRGDPELDSLASFLPFGSITPAGIAAVRAAYGDGWRGHYEAIWPTAAARAGLRVADIGGCGEFVDPRDVNRHYTSTPMRHLAPGTFQYRPYHADYDRAGGKLWHPIREGQPTPPPPSPIVAAEQASTARSVAAEGDPAGCAP